MQHLHGIEALLFIGVAWAMAFGCLGLGWDLAKRGREGWALIAWMMGAGFAVTPFLQN